MGNWKINAEWKNGKSYITGEELFLDYVEIINKIGAILYDDTYYDDTKRFARSILEFAIDHDFITWKQANAILRIKTAEERRKLYHSVRSSRFNTKFVPYIYTGKNTTDKEKDQFSTELFGRTFFKEEMEGYIVQYRKDGSRYFALPTGTESIMDYL